MYGTTDERAVVVSRPAGDRISIHVSESSLRIGPQVTGAPLVTVIF